MNLTGEQLSEEQLNEIEEMAGLFLSPESIAVNLELSEDDTEYFIAAIQLKNMKNPIVAAYYKGRLTTKVELRKAIKKSALNGSSPSQQMMLNFLKDSKK